MKTCHDETQQTGERDIEQQPGAAQPRHGEIADENIAHRAATESGDKGEDEYAEKIDLLAARREHAGNRSHADTKVIEQQRCREIHRGRLVGRRSRQLELWRVAIGRSWKFLSEFGEARNEAAIGKEELSVFDSHETVESVFLARAVATETGLGDLLPFAVGHANPLRTKHG